MPDQRRRGRTTANCEPIWRRDAAARWIQARQSRVLQKLKAPVFRSHITPADDEKRGPQCYDGFDTHELCGSAFRCIDKSGNLQQLRYDFSFTDIATAVKKKEGLGTIAFHQASQVRHCDFNFADKHRPCGLYANRIRKVFDALLDFAQAHPATNNNFLYASPPQDSAHVHVVERSDDDCVCFDVKKVLSTIAHLGKCLRTVRQKRKERITGERTERRDATRICQLQEHLVGA